MSKAIRSYPKEERSKVIARRIQGKTGGLGYLSACDAKKKGYSNMSYEEAHGVTSGKNQDD